MNPLKSNISSLFSLFNQDTNTLERIVRDYPASSLARILLAKKYQEENNPVFEQFREEASFYMGNVPWYLFSLSLAGEETESNGLAAESLENKVEPAIDGQAETLEDNFVKEENNLTGVSAIMGEDAQENQEASRQEFSDFSAEEIVNEESQAENSAPNEITEGISVEVSTTESISKKVPEIEENLSHEAVENKEDISLISEIQTDQNIEDGSAKKAEVFPSSSNEPQVVAGDGSDETKEEDDPLTEMTEGQSLQIAEEDATDVPVDPEPEETKQPESSTTENLVNLTPAEDNDTESVEGTAETESESDLEFEPLHTIDYFASQGIKLREEDLKDDRLSQQVKSFTGWLKSMKQLHPGRLPEQNEVIEKIIQNAAEISNVGPDVLTEAMADVLVKQNKKDKAIEMYQKLSLMNPSKSAYFAAKIENLKTS